MQVVPIFSILIYLYICIYLKLASCWHSHQWDSEHQLCVDIYTLCTYHIHVQTCIFTYLSICIYVCMYICVFMYVCIYVYVYTNTSRDTYLCSWRQFMISSSARCGAWALCRYMYGLYLHIHVQIFISTHLHISLYIYIYIVMYICEHTHLYIYILQLVPIYDKLSSEKRGVRST